MSSSLNPRQKQLLYKKKKAELEARQRQQQGSAISSGEPKEMKPMRAPQGMSQSLALHQEQQKQTKKHDIYSLLNQRAGQFHSKVKAGNIKLFESVIKKKLLFS